MHGTENGSKGLSLAKDKGHYPLGIPILEEATMILARGSGRKEAGTISSGGLAFSTQVAKSQFL